MALTTLFDIVFAVATAAAAASLALAALRKATTSTLIAVSGLLAAGAVTGWTVYALRHHREVAVAAGGITVCALVVAGAVALRRALARAEEFDAHLAAAQTRLREQIAAEAADRAAELERTLARARADSVSLLQEEERKLAEEHRREFLQREREIANELTASLNATQSQVDQRVASWAQDLERSAETTKARIAELAQRQRQLVSDVEVRLAADAERFSAESEEQRAGLARLRSEIEKALEETLAAAHTEVDSHAAERRRALHELDERLRRRERELLERVEREEIDAAARVRSDFDDVVRRQVEQMERAIERATNSYAEEATQQFAALIKSSREDAARRLSRELDRSVEVFGREAEAVLAERLAHVGDAGSQRLERRLTDATKVLEHQRDEWLTALDSRIGEVEADVRRRLDELAADAEAERAVLEARVQELLRRLDTTVLRQS
ncbi:MAG TPA: hypothetical protein VIK66_00885 [Gaiellaceae bacterium]